MQRKLLEELILPIGDRLTSGTFIKNLRKWRNISRGSEAELKELQKIKTEQLISHAVQHVPYYAKVVEGMTHSGSYRLEDFPILSKEIIHDKGDNLIASTYNKNNLIQSKSSGSSGMQTTIYIDKEEQSICRALQVLWWEWAGYRFGDRLYQTGINPDRGLIKQTKDILLSTEYISAFNHSRESIISVMRKASKNSNPVLAGYASSLFEMARIAEEEGVEVSFKTAISWGDKMFDHFRCKIEDLFSCHVYDTYASAEMLLIAAQFDLPYYYIMSPHIYLEILNEDGRPVPEGEMGRVVVTKLDGYAMPLIRYDIGDLAAVLPREEYPSERNLQLPLLKNIVGRNTDIVRTPSGKIMNVHFFTGIFEHLPEVRQFLVEQFEEKEMTIRYIPGNSFELSVLDKVKGMIYDHLNEEYPINFVQVDDIPPTPSGKPQIVQSRVFRESLRAGNRHPQDG